ncbi:MAG TPA: precorrin-6y C5,15-methyltransferase (decarboxylating) subunit CbiE [Streptosporangiaceae bacterium]|nr:precorrin-6y C5,15-methyltransferase (decarboxylating) subunit CbiE [Streptosporangiaceae bacterium]
MTSPQCGQSRADRVTVVGIGADGWPSLSEEARAVLTEASAIAGSPRQLALLPDLTARRVPLPSPLLEHIDQLVRDYPGLCVLASGDPTLHGIGATLTRRLGATAVRIFPAVSSVALACARLGWPQQEITVVSLMSQRPEATLAAMQPGARLIVLCPDRRTPPVVARVLTDRGWGASELTVLEALGGPAERVSLPQQAAELTGDALADLCVLAVTARQEPGAVAGRTPGLPDSAYETDGQITRRELRALALAALRPGPRALLWDVGAGSGSVGIEWMRADPLARAVAIEARTDRAERVGRNAAALGVPALRVIIGTAPAVLAGLPDPDAVFIGGGLTTDGVFAACWQRLPPGGRLVAHAVTIESETLLQSWQQERGGELVKVAVSYREPLGKFTAWRPALPVTQWQVTRP